MKLEKQHAVRLKFDFIGLKIYFITLIMTLQLKSWCWIFEIQFTEGDCHNMKVLLIWLFYQNLE